MWAKELKLKGCKKIDSIWHKRNLPLTQLLLLRVSLLQQILPLSRWFQMSSSWPDSLTTWLFLRTDNPPQPLPPVFTRSVLGENTRLFILPAALVETYTHPPSSCMISLGHSYLCSATNKLSALDVLKISDCDVVHFYALREPT